MHTEHISVLKWKIAQLEYANNKLLDANASLKDQLFQEQVLRNHFQDCYLLAIDLEQREKSLTLQKTVDKKFLPSPWVV